MIKPKIIWSSQKGLTLLEVIVSLTILSAASIGLVNLASRYSDDTVTNVTATQMRSFGDASRAYIKDNYSAVMAVATPGAPAMINVSTLIATGKLPPGFSAVNSAGQTMCTLVIQPTANRLQALVVGEGKAMGDLGLGSLAATMGGSGGGVYSQASTTIRGAVGGWAVPTATFDSLANNLGTNCAGAAGPVRVVTGTPVMALWFENGDTNAAFLARDAVPGRPELNTVNTPILINSVSVIGTACTTTGAMARDASGQIISCQVGKWGKASKSAQSYRFLFKNSTNWTVPAGVTTGFVTMAGGGGSGAGWRISNMLGAGHSGGYVFSQPVNFIEGENLQVIVGAGATGHAPYANGTPATPGPPYYIYYPPASGDAGTGGYPGGPSKIISPSMGTLLECDGGSGAAFGGLDNYSGGQVPGPQSGATLGSGSPIYPSPSRPASGPYASAGGPGACGPAMYGIGNSGVSTWSVNSGSYKGGTTPFGYGSGGDIWVSGCYIDPNTVGLCVGPGNGRDGVIFIDVLY